MERLDVIIRTRAEATRRHSLLRAIDSLMYQRGIAVTPIVIVNGDRWDGCLVNQLQSMRALRTYRIKGNLAEALLHGVASVAAAQFAFLDDDDEYLPDSLMAAVEMFLEAPDVDLVVTNGIVRYSNGAMRPAIDQPGKVRADPLTALSTANWLFNCGSLYRRTSFSPQWFSAVPTLFEWTWIAYKACLNKNIAFSKDFTYIYHDSDETLSKSDAMIEAEDAALACIMHFDLPPNVRTMVRRKHSAALHAISDHFRRSGEIGLALRYHWRSLLGPQGWRYLPYSRHLVTGVRLANWHGPRRGR